jgi:GH15 family glucan-1,4-alpha-glucosidase
MYRKISDYGIIGDMHSVALISKDGSIDYCSMPHIDSPTVFAALLDDEKGGYFKIQPQEHFSSRQEYIRDTNILSCAFTTKNGEAQLIDFMPIHTKELFDTQKEHSLHRCVRGLSGRIDFILQCCPRPNYALGLPSIKREGDTFKIRLKGEVFTFIVMVNDYVIIENNSERITIHFSLERGEVAHFDFIYGESQLRREETCGFKETQKFWVDWLSNCLSGKCQFLGEYTAMVNRSLLVLKLLTFQPTGAIAASATTSLPECIGGERNWDYRFTWIRDASFTLRALFNLGHIHEADSFIRWLHGTYKKYGSRNLQIMYSLRGESNLQEKILKHLKGYRNSRPVRVGNSAYRQNQWDIYGEVMDTAFRLSNYIGKIDEGLWPFFKNICNLARKNWRKQDEGIWEVRNGPFDFVYSKVMCWVALDRGIKIANRYGFNAPIKEWEEEREKIREEILSRGYDRTINSFVQRYDSKDLDASLLLMPLMNFLPFDDERVRNTIEACKKYLMRDGFLLRYKSSDGLKGNEGSFLLCNFWLIQCLAFSKKIEEAKNLLATTMKSANHLGLFSEEYDSKENEMLGNFPQAFSHIGFINTVIAIFNVEYRLSQQQLDRGVLAPKKKFIFTKIILNKPSTFIKVRGKSAKRNMETTKDKDIAHHLKETLNNLQGAYFDSLEGKVNYSAMRQSDSYKNYTNMVEKLNIFNPFSLNTDEEKKAFWINIYNILIIHGVIELDIESSVKEVFNFFNRIGYSIGGLYFTPDDIEHGVLRINRPKPATGFRQFSWFDKRKVLCLKQFDPRIHFALVCASSSCPPIEFYDAESIDKQLDMAGRSFINRRGIILDKDNNTLYLSQIFKWYKNDFGHTQNEVVYYVLKYAEDNLKSYVINNLNKLKIAYLPYNWNLNRALI